MAQFESSVLQMCYDAKEALVVQNERSLLGKAAALAEAVSTILPEDSVDLLLGHTCQESQVCELQHEKKSCTACQEAEDERRLVFL